MSSNIDDVGAYTLEQFQAALAGVEEKRSSRTTGRLEGGNGARKKLSDRSLRAPTPELALDALSVWRNTDENLPTHESFVTAIAAIKAALGPDREKHYVEVEEWALEYGGNDPEYVRARWDSIKDSALGWDWLCAQARAAGFYGDAQADFADPPYDPASFFDLDANAVRARCDELAILKGGYPAAYEAVRTELLRRSTISAAELDARVSKELDKLRSHHETPNDVVLCVKRPKYLFLDELGELPEPNDFVQDLLCDGECSVIYGAPNAGKSFFALDLAMHVALGWKWFGREVERGAVVYVAAEGGGGMKRRVAAFLRRHGVEQTKRLPFALIPYTVDFRDKRNIEGLIEIVQEISARLGIPVRWIIVDTLSRALAGGDENSSTDMGALVRGADRVRLATGAHLSLVHHSGKDHAKGARGHSLLLGAVDTEIEIKRHDETSGAIQMTVTKQRELARGAGFAFKLVSVVLGTNARGKPVTSCVVEAAVIKPALTETEQDALEILNTMLHESDATYVELPAWREAILSRGDLLAGQSRDTRRTQWQRMRKSLEKKGIIEISGNKVGVKN